MAKFEITEGKPGQGKSLYSAGKARDLIIRNKKYFNNTGNIRYLYSNIKFSDEFEEFATLENGVCLIKYWDRIQKITELHDVDLLWDEIATELDSRNFANLTDELKRFLSQYRKRGVDIYANTQDFSMIDLRARLMITNVYTLKKLCGSPDPSPTKPPIKKIWGIVMVREVENILSDDPHNKKYSFLPSFFFIDKDDVDIYDTRQDIPQSPPAPLRHMVYECEHKDDPNHNCKHQKVVHR